MITSFNKIQISILLNLKLLKIVKTKKLKIIFKKCDSENLKNYRLFTLINIEYKIIAKVLTEIEKSS
jgi:hypothetical protein